MLIGIDAGGTSTRAVVLDRTGQCWGFGAGAGGNPVALGPAQAGQSIRDAAQRAIRAAHAAGMPGADDGAVAGSGASVLAMAGASSFVAPGVMAAQVREISGVAHVEVASDLVAMFASGTPSHRGYVLVSGTGAAALRIEDDRVAAAADGLGWLLGDAGSGFWIGHRAVRAALGALSGHDRPTVMAGMLQQQLGLEQEAKRTSRGRFIAVETAVDTFYQMPPIELSKFAALAFTAAKVPESLESGSGVTGPVVATGAGHARENSTPADIPGNGLFAPDADPVAVRILMKAVERLVRTMSAVRSDDLPGPVVLGGSVARRLPGLAEAVIASFRAAGAREPEISIADDGTVGAAVLTLREAGVAVDHDIFDRVKTSLADLRS